MGVFVGYTGKWVLSDGKKNGFQDKMRKLLSYGGMMQLSEIPDVDGHSLILIHDISPVTDPDDYSEFHYNYFEDDVWESAYIHHDGNIGTGKVGGAEFHDTAIAAYTLMEFEAVSTITVDNNGSPLNALRQVAWINHLFDTKYTMEKHCHPWANFEQKCIDYVKHNYEPEVNGLDYVQKIVPRTYMDVIDGIELADICYCNGTDSLMDADLQPGSYPEAIRNCRREIEKYIADGNNPVAVYNLVKLPISERIAVEGDLAVIAQMSLRLPARALVYLTAHVTHEKFWEQWSKVYKDAYSDEDSSGYVSDAIQKEREQRWKEPVPPIRTSVYLRQDDWFTFLDTPDEIKKQPNYYLTDDERAYWWDGTDEVSFSEKMIQWLTDLGKRHKDLRSRAEILAGQKWLHKLTVVLSDANDYYKRVFPFQDMYYEFLMNGSDLNYVAAIDLFREICEENKEKGKIIEKVRGAWDLCSKNVICNPGRMAVKRYLAVMANRKLRKQYFDF